MIYHYTTIETLALILQSKKMRFSCLTTVDDILEGSLFEKKNLAQYVFVSCWTKEPDENVALWKMYTHGKGVRIGLPDYPWEMHPFDVGEWKRKGVSIGHDPSKKYHSPFKFDDVFGEKHVIFPPYSIPMPMNTVFAKAVEYLDTTELTEKYADIYSENIDHEGGSFQLLIKPIDFGRYKHKRWEFQKEFRFVLFVCPLDEKPNFLDPNVHDKMTRTLYNYLKDERESPIKDFYVGLSNESIKEMEITMGPLSTNADEIIVQSLMEKYGITGSILKSISAIRK